jgi:hypothetical protein
MSEERSVVSSLVGSAVEFVSGNSKRIVIKEVVEKLKLSLARDAAEKTILNGGYSGEPVVKSPHIELMVAAYSIASRGRIAVMCSPVDNGKSTAAEFFIHGNHPFRPERSLMVSAAGMDNFALQLSELMGVKSASLEMDELLCMALAQKSQDSSAAVDLVLKAGDVVDSSLCFTPSSRHSLKHEIEMYGRKSIPPPAVDIGRMPVLIIDNFNEATEKNKKFIEKLFNLASAFKVFVFVLTTKRDWATTLVGLNGGAKIKPLHGNVNNADYELAGGFTGVPDWNSLPWSVETLRDLILPKCQKYGKDPTEVVPDGAIMTPVIAQDKLNALLLATRNS